MDIRKVKKLIDLVKATGITELEIKEGEESVKISLEKRDQSKNISVLSDSSYSVTPEQIKIETLTNKIDKEEKALEGYVVKSPMVGTVYLSSSPGTPSFVKIGQKINKGDTLCIIEAMKMFNKVESDIDGTISACLIENGQSVEFEQKLFILEKEKQ